MTQKPFFVGFLPVPQGLRGFLAIVALVLIAAFGLTAWLISSTQTDPGDGSFRFDLGQQQLTGIIASEPYPILHVIEGTEHVPAGHSIMLSGNGKNGTQGRTDRLDGQVVRMSGILLQRGNLDMLQMRGRPEEIDFTGDTSELPKAVSLGRWRVAGEICDGKCLAGAMRPGTGLAHRACANLCLEGGIPPVFVASQPIEGHEFFLLGNSDGGPVTAQLLDFTALYVSIEGEIELRGDLPVFLIDPESVVLSP